MQWSFRNGTPLRRRWNDDEASLDRAHDSQGLCGLRRPRLSDVSGAASVLGASAIAATACCGPAIVAWISQGFVALGGLGLLVTVNRFEAPISGLIAVLAAFSALTARHSAVRYLYILLALLLLAVLVLRVAWDLGVTLPFQWAPISLAFANRQLAMAGVAPAALAVHVISILRDRHAARQCKPGPRHAPHLAASGRQNSESL